MGPESMQIELPCKQIGAAHRGGGFAEVFKCEHGGREVAVKVLKVYSNSDLRAITHVSYRRPPVPLHVLAHLQ